MITASDSGVFNFVVVLRDEIETETYVIPVKINYELREEPIVAVVEKEENTVQKEITADPIELKTNETVKPLLLYLNQTDETVSAEGNVIIANLKEDKKRPPGAKVVGWF